VDFWAIGNVFIDRLGKGVGLLEHHANTGAQLHHIHAIGMDILSIQLNKPGYLGCSNRVIHAIEAAKESRLPAPGRADESGDVIGRDINRNSVDCLVLTVEHTDITSADLGSGIVHIGMDYSHQLFSNLLRR
jgi:hypothetical protein